MRVLSNEMFFRGFGDATCPKPEYRFPFQLSTPVVGRLGRFQGYDGSNFGYQST